MGHDLGHDRLHEETGRIDADEVNEGSNWATRRGLTEPVHVCMARPPRRLLLLPAAGCNIPGASV